MIYIVALVAILLACFNGINFLTEVTNLHNYNVLDAKMNWFVEVGDKYITRGEQGLGWINQVAATDVNAHDIKMLIALILVTTMLLSQTAKFTIKSK